MDPGQTPRDDEPLPGGAGDGGSPVFAGMLRLADGFRQAAEAASGMESRVRAVREIVERGAVGGHGIGRMVWENHGQEMRRVRSRELVGDPGQTFPDVLAYMTAGDPSGRLGLSFTDIMLEEPAVDRANRERLYALPYMTEDEVRAELGTLLGLDANEELIRSTRAEFTRDPHDYDMPLHDGMHWSPPPEGEDTPSCPA